MKGGERGMRTLLYCAAVHEEFPFLSLGSARDDANSNHFDPKRDTTHSTQGARYSATHHTQHSTPHAVQQHNALYALRLVRAVEVQRID